MLEFLSNNYIYFLIAAGVLFFALIGLLVDLKKKQGDAAKGEEEIPNVNIPEPTVKEETPVQSEFNPAPPMPVEEPTPVVNTVAETPVNPVEEVPSTPVVDETPAIMVGTESSAPASPEAPVEELK